MKINNMKIRYDLVLAVIALAIPIVMTNDYHLRVINMVLLYSVVALSINLVVGFCGQLDFGRAAFVGIGAYASALMMLKLNLPFWVSFLGAGLFAAFFGLLLGLLCMKTSFDYLTLITIGFLEIVRQILLNWIPVTNGAMGLRLVPAPSLFGFSFDTNIRFFYFALVFLVICYVLIERLSKSKIGRAFGALRDDPVAASYSGINVSLYKTINFTIASFFSGIAGSALVHYTQYASPYNYTLDQSIYQLQFAIIGGLGSLFGSIVGTAILVIAPEISRVLYEYRLMFIGIIMVVMMIYAPNGFLGKNGIGEKVIGLSRFLTVKKKGTIADEHSI